MQGTKFSAVPPKFIVLLKYNTLINARNECETSTATENSRICCLFSAAAPVWRSMITLFLRELSAGDSLSLKKV